MKVVFKEVGKDAVLLESNLDLSSQQKLVGGFLEYCPVMLGDNKYYMVVNEEGKFTGLPVNFNLFINNEIYDIIVGNVFFINCDEEKSCTESDLDYIKSYFSNDILNCNSLTNNI